MKRPEELQLVKALLDGRAVDPPHSAEGTDRLSNAWHCLELPEPPSPPPGFAEELAVRARSERTLLPGFALSPRWASVAAALLVAAGAAGGAGLGAYALSEEPTIELTVQEEADLALFSDEGLLDDYLSSADADDPASAESEP